MKDIQNAVIYARYSSHSQQEQSIEGQLRDCYTYAEREGLSVVGEYIDRALSGKTDNRHDFLQMLDDSAKHQFSFIIVWKLDRFARNRCDSSFHKYQLRKHDVRVLSATENITDDPEGQMLEGMLESIAEYYSANLTKHIKRGMRESVINGTSTGGVPPVGYKCVDKRLVIDEDTAPIIRYAFEKYAAGVTKKQLIEELNAKGVRNARGNPLTSTSFYSAMKNQKYIGINIYSGVETVGVCPRIIDDETFFKVQERFAAVSRAPAEGKAKVEYLLRGKAYCGYCGTRMIGESGHGRNGDVHNYYACSRKKKERACTKKNEKKDIVERYVVEQTCLYVLDPSRIAVIAEAVVAEYKKEFNDDKLKEYERRAEKLEREANSCVDSIVSTDSAAVKRRLEKKLEELELQKTDIDIDISKLRIASGIQYTKEQVVEWLKSFCAGNMDDAAFQRRMIDVFVNSIYIYDDKIVIFYNMRSSKQTNPLVVLDSVEKMDDSNLVRISNDSLHQKNSLKRKFYGCFSYYLKIYRGA